MSTELDPRAFNEGWDAFAWRWLGAHPYDGGVRFAVWAPDAERVDVVGDFNAWQVGRHAMFPVGESGIWVAHLDGVPCDTRYKYRISPRSGGQAFEKADPFGFRTEPPPRTASVVHHSTYRWNDASWMERRAATAPHASPMQIYEVHLGSWRHVEGGLSYRSVAGPLAQYAVEHGFTHVEFLPLMEHPFYGSWGYQVTGFFAPTSRYGTPDDLRYLIDTLHQAGVGVILDWVPAHFPSDAHGLGRFDGTHLYEHADPRRGWHPDWETYIFNYERNEVRSFLLSSANYWLTEFHADGLRVDAVASMLYRDYSRDEGEWVPNERGGRENDAAVSLLRKINEVVYAEHPGVVMIAEESTAWPGVSRPTDSGGLGFGMKWDMGWMHDTLHYLQRDPIHRRFHHDELTFRSVYAFSENYVLALSHDEVVHGKGSMYERMPGDDWQRLANLRLLYGYQAGQPGKSLLFMGMEFGQRREWNHDRELDWGDADNPLHDGLRRWVAAVNRLVVDEPALYAMDTSEEGVVWMGSDDREQSVLTFARLAPGQRPVVVVCNFTPVARPDYRVGLPAAGPWVERLNSDDARFGGSGLVHSAPRSAEDEPWMGQPWSTRVLAPPLAVLFLVPGDAA